MVRRCKSGLKRLFPGWPAAEEGLRAPSNAPSPTPLSHPSRRSRASSRSPRASPPGPWINAACVCAADVSLGHEHDFRVKHPSEALNDKHGPLAGEYAAQPGPARGRRGRLPAATAGPSRMARLSRSPSISLLRARGLLASLQLGVCTWLSGPGPRGEVAAPWKAGRGEVAPWRAGSPTSASPTAPTPGSPSLGA